MSCCNDCRAIDLRGSGVGAARVRGDSAQASADTTAVKRIIHAADARPKGCAEALASDIPAHLYQSIDCSNWKDFKMTGLISKDLDQAIIDINRLREPRVVAAATTEPRAEEPKQAD